MHVIKLFFVHILGLLQIFISNMNKLQYMNFVPIFIINILKIDHDTHGYNLIKIYRLELGTTTVVSTVMSRV